MKTGYKPVVETYIRDADELVHLVIDEEEIISTFDHPYYVPGTGFVSAVDLCIGTKLINSDGKEIVVEEMYREKVQDDSVKVHNFQVDDYHTYYVGVKNILVHNSTYKTKTVITEKGEEEIPILGKPGSPSWKQAIKDLRNAKGKGQNFIANNAQEAELFLNEAKSYLSKYPAYEKGIPSQNYQIHPIDNEYGMPHIKFSDYIPGHRKAGCQGHIFWEE